MDLVDGVAVGVGLGADDLAACDLGECRSGGLGQRVAGEGRLVAALTAAMRAAPVVPASSVVRGRVDADDVESLSR